MPNIRTNIQKNITKYRKERGMTQVDLAKRLKISSPTVASWEQGKSIPDIDKLYELSLILGVDLITISGFTLDGSNSSPNDNRQLAICLDDMPNASVESAETLTPDEHQLVTDYREFNDEGKEKVREYVADLADNPKYKKRSEIVLDKQA